MNLFKQRSSLELLELFLDKERAAVLAGDYAVLRTLAKEKERLQLVHGPSEPANYIAKIRRKIEHNQEMLQAAANGIRAVSDRLTGISKPENPLLTYDCHGQRLSHLRSARKLERRA